MRDGARRVTYIVEVVGMEGDVITTQELFNYQFQGETGEGRLRGAFPVNRHPPLLSSRAPSISWARPRLARSDLTMALDPATIMAAGMGLMVALTVLLIGGILGGAEARRYRRRLALVAAGKKANDPSADLEARSLARRESATPMIDRLIKSWLPRRELLVAKLQRTGRPITLGHYAMTTAAFTTVRHDRGLLAASLACSRDGGAARQRARFRRRPRLTP